MLWRQWSPYLPRTFVYKTKKRSLLLSKTRHHLYASQNVHKVFYALRDGIFTSTVFTLRKTFNKLFFTRCETKSILWPCLRFAKRWNDMFLRVAIWNQYFYRVYALWYSSKLKLCLHFAIRKNSKEIVFTLRESKIVIKSVYRLVKRFQTPSLRFAKRWNDMFFYALRDGINIATVFTLCDIVSN